MAPPKVPLDVRFEKWTRKTETGCWEWLGKRDRKGYAHIKHDGRDRKAATVAYEWKNGPVPEGLEISHTCPHGGLFARCVNPDHLVAETHAENLKRREWSPKGQRYVMDCRQCGKPKTLTGRKRQEWVCTYCRAERSLKWRQANPDQYAEWFRVNKEHINISRATRRLKRISQNGNE